MTRNYAMPGFEIAVRDGVLELRIEGERTGDNSLETQAALERMIRICAPAALLFDVRSAEYAMAPSEWRDRVQVIARLARNFPLALVDRPSRREPSLHTVKAHRKMGGQCEIFTSRGAARAWLRKTMHG